MNGIIHDAKDNTGGCLGNVRMPAIGQDGNVMVPMQKDEGFLVNENEKGVNQFPVNWVFDTLKKINLKKKWETQLWNNDGKLLSSENTR